VVRTGSAELKAYGLGALGSSWRSMASCSVDSLDPPRGSIAALTLVEHISHLLREFFRVGFPRAAMRCFLESGILLSVVLIRDPCIQIFPQTLSHTEDQHAHTFFK